MLKSLRGRFHAGAQDGPTSYVADSPETAWLEVNARFGRVHADPDAFLLFAVRLPGAKLADLRDSGVRARIGITLAELTGDPAAPRCAAVAGKLRRPGSGYAGLIYPSLRNRPGGICAALFLERLEGISAAPADEAWRRYKEKHR